jgi:DNA recombination protein RmuC
VPVWLLVVVQFVTLTGIVAILIAFFRGHTKNSQAESLQRLLDIAGRTEASLGQLAARQDAFALNSAQATATLRSEISKTLSSEFSSLRTEVINSIVGIGEQTRLALEALRQSVTERQDKLALEMNRGQSALLETVNARLGEFQIGSNERFNGFQKTQLEQGNSARETIDSTLSRMGRDLRDAVAELKTEVKERLEAVTMQTTALVKAADEQQASLRTTVEQRLDRLNESNAKKLDEMRETVDEKLHKTLESRLTQSFGLVTDQLGKVQTGLGEMKELAVNVGDLKRVLNNVSTRGTLGNTLLSAQLEQVLAPSQFAREVRIRPNTDERVDFVIRLPYGDEEPVLLPIDSKFPKEDWDRLEDAAILGDLLAVEAARKGLEAQIKKEAKKIAEKYIFPPVTTNFAFMYLPSEGLFSEALRIPGLVDELQLKYRVSMAGPTNFMAILNSLQMGFRTLAIQKKSSEVWQLLAAAKVEFQNFGALMATVEKQVGTVQNTIKKVHSKTRTINRQLKDVEVLEVGAPAAVRLLEFTGAEATAGPEELMLGTVSSLAASEDADLAGDEDEDS